MLDEERYAPPKAKLELEREAAAPPAAAPGEPVGLGGWLLLVGFGLIVNPLRILAALATVYLPIFRGGAWTRLTTPGDPSYHPLWGPVLGFEVLGNLLLLALVSCTLVLFFRRSRRTPRFFIAWCLSGVGFSLIDYLLVNMIPSLATPADADSLQDVLRAGVAAAIWVPYFLVSKRVKNTFVC